MQSILERAWITVVREQGKHLPCRIMEVSPTAYCVATEEPLIPGETVRLGSRDHVDVQLYWQRWRLPSAHLDRLSDTVRRESARGGIHPDVGSHPQGVSRGDQGRSIVE